MPDYSDLEPQAILAEMGVTGVRAVKPVSGGQDTVIWRVDTDERSYALRLMRVEQSRVAEREVELMQLAAGQGLPVPSVALHRLWQGRPALLLDWCEGRTVIAEFQKRLWRWRRLGYLMGQAQARLHRANLPPAIADHNEDLIKVIGPHETALQERLQQVVKGPPRLLHLDYHPLNVMVGGNLISGIIDWTNGSTGDPRFDVARSRSIMEISPLRNLGAPPVVVASSLRLLEYGWARGYRAEASRLDHMAIFNAWAGAFMLQDLLPHQAARKLEETDFDRIRAWTQKWKRRAGIE